jgi:hypothetical protein
MSATDTAEVEAARRSRRLRPRRRTCAGARLPGAAAPDLLRDFRPDASTPAPVAAQIGRPRQALMSWIAATTPGAAVAEAVRLNPNAAEPHMAASRLALIENDRAAAMAATERARWQRIRTTSRR